MTIDKIIRISFINEDIFKINILPYLNNIYLTNEEKNIYLSIKELNKILKNNINKLFNINNIVKNTYDYLEYSDEELFKISILSFNEEQNIESGFFTSFNIGIQSKMNNNLFKDFNLIKNYPEEINVYYVSINFNLYKEDFNYFNTKILEKYLNAIYYIDSIEISDNVIYFELEIYLEFNKNENLWKKMKLILDIDNYINVNKKKRYIKFLENNFKNLLFKHLNLL
jgi:hypothetical protein